MAKKTSDGTNKTTIVVAVITAISGIVVALIGLFPKTNDPKPLPHRLVTDTTRSADIKDNHGIIIQSAGNDNTNIGINSNDSLKLKRHKVQTK